MKTMKKAAAVAAVIGLTVTGSGLSYASGTTAAPTHTATHTGKSLDNNGVADSVITGYIKVTSISVQVPIKSAFDIDPNKAISTEAGKESTGDVQMGNQAENYSIINESTVPLDISINKVAVSGAQLVSTVGELGAADKNVAFAIREKSEAAPTVPTVANDDIWMKAGDPLATAYKVAAAAGKNTIEAKGAADDADKLQMKVYALTTKGWKAGESFTVTPTFTVSLH